jgi:hypothetical protein
MSVIKGERPGVTLHVCNVKQAAEWYKRYLGLEIGPTDGRNYAEMFAEKKYLFHICFSPDAAPLTNPVFGLQSNDIESSHSALSSAGIDVTPIQWNSDNAGFHFRDADGNAVGIGQFFTHRITNLDEIRIAAVEVERNDWLGSLENLERIFPVESNKRVVFIQDYRSGGASYAGFPIAAQTIVPDGLILLTIPSGKYGLKWHYGKMDDSGKAFVALEDLLAEDGLAVKGLRLAFQRRPVDGDNTEADLYIALDFEVNKESTSGC